MSNRELVFFTADGTAYVPKRNYNGQTLGSSYHAHVDRNATSTREATVVPTIEGLAKAMLVDGLCGRVGTPDSRSPEFLPFDGKPLVRYELDPSIALRLGIPSTGMVAGVTKSSALLQLRQRFLRAFPDFVGVGAFSATTGSYYEMYRHRVDALLAAVTQHSHSGWAVLQDVLAASQGGRGALPPFFDGDVNWRVPRAHAVDATGFEAALDVLVAGRDDPAVAAATFNETLRPALDAIDEANTFRDTRVVPSTVLATVAPDRAISVRYQLYVNAERLLNNRPLFANKPMSEAEYRGVLALAEQIRGAMVGWGWAPRDLWDVHGFILATCGKKETEIDDAAVLARFRSSPLFRAMQEQWTPEQTSAFCMMARAAHDIGLDWYFTNMPHEPVRLGRKPERDRRAKATIGYLNDRTIPRLWMSDRPVRPQIDRHDFPLDAPTGSIFADAVHAHRAALQSWEAPSPPRPGRWPDEAGLDASAEFQQHLNGGEDVVPSQPTNLILYGPPGTGKTFATAAEAVRLCGEQVPADREELMAAYHRLADAGRIEFVTFHQSMAYEDFVEGLRPVTNPNSGGFSLEPQNGIFRRVVDAALAPPERRQDSGFDPSGHNIYKMSLGDVTKPDEAYLFEECVGPSSDVAIGFGAELDLTPDRFSSKEEILHALTALGVPNPAYEASQLHMFRNKIQQGDVLVIASGKTKYRAIGTVAGEYAYHEDRDTEYRHRRPMKWLLVAPQGRPVSELLANNFQMQTLYKLPDAAIDWNGLRSVLRGNDAPVAAKRDVVLIIDEVNRANISKVFGELITLLEADKRLGAANELKVRLPYSGDLFGVPANLHVVGTMNTADRSIALIDKALRRRFTFKEMMPDADLPALAEAGEEAGVKLPALLRTINDRIEYLLDREHQIGHAWFLGCTSRAALDATMREKILPLIAEYFFEDWGKVADVLGGRDDNPFLERIELKRPPGYGDEEARYRWRVRNKFDHDAYVRAIGS